ncbi:Asp23/Gls24 family envelope stress response protein [Streptomyces sp. NPDC050418]|uniref:Asp23/Gls24 family envelope stress response protein n=1 Tax=Streptomyces sp. NPDC050418 TaxID=3365612 RepID=UPI0037BB06B6
MAGDDSASRPGVRTVPPAERGATSVADRVVEKIAARAAYEALTADVPAPGVRPRAAIRVRDTTVRVRITLDLGYPCDIGAQCAAVRRQVTERVEALAGMTVPEVAVRVDGLHPAHAVGRTR